MIYIKNSGEVVFIFIQNLLYDSINPIPPSNIQF